MKIFDKLFYFSHSVMYVRTAYENVRIVMRKRINRLCPMAARLRDIRVRQQYGTPLSRPP